MTTDNALINRKQRFRSAITAADSSDPTVASTFITTKGCSYIEININGLSSSQTCTVRPFFFETVDNSGAMINYISRGAEFSLSLTSGDTFNLPGVNGRPVYIKVESLTAGSNINIDVACGRVPPGLNV
ncbi:MAG: hypothetical protein AB7V50_04870 [Vampirovibrionia bacterium]